MTDRAALAVVCVLCVAGVSRAATRPPIGAADTRWDAQRILRSAVTQDLRLSSDGASVTLERGIVYEDDGPAAGYTYQPSVEKVTNTVRIRKRLIIDSPAADAATLLVAPGGTLKCEINGETVTLPEPRRCGSRWQAYDLSPSLLQPGENRIVLWGRGSVWIAREQDYAAGSLTRTAHPDRSDKSSDAGQTWNAQSLGDKDNIDGEYCVRLFLDQFRSQGTATLDVLDLANLNERTVAPPIEKLGPVRIHVDTHTPQLTNVKVRVRTGTTPRPDAEHWSAWRALDADGVLEQPEGRYLQIALTLSTDDPRQAPSVNSVRVTSGTTAPNAWADRIKVLDQDNPRRVRSSIAFRYERYDHPALRTLRRDYKLDEATAGVDDEWSLIQRLAAWSADRWKGIGHLSTSYPAWNALEILKPHADGTPTGGFCLQHNLVFLQACESYGIPGRVVSLGPGTVTRRSRGGHEVVEIWSNIHRKWVYVDGQFAWYFRDVDSGTPLSLWELRRRQLAAMRDEAYRRVEVAHIGAPRREWAGLSDWPPFIELRLVPRSNFLGQAAALPLNQGMRGWFWTGHHVWSDSHMPAREIYSRRVGVESNWRWTLNQAHAVLEATSQPGVVRVHLDTQTPGFDTFVAQIDGGAPAAVRSGFLWKLHEGINALTVWPRNDAGRDGIPCRFKLRYEQAELGHDEESS